MMNVAQKIRTLLPYQKPFLFVDEIEMVDANGITGTYTYREDEFFYKGHFPDRPITPGVIMIETMAQIGLVAYGMFLMKIHESLHPLEFVFSNSKVDFNKPVYPGQKVVVKATKKFFRMGKLKVQAELFDESGDCVCRGELSGIILNERWRKE